MTDKDRQKLIEYAMANPLGSWCVWTDLPDDEPTEPQTEREKYVAWAVENPLGSGAYSQPMSREEFDRLVYRTVRTEE